MYKEFVKEKEFNGTLGNLIQEIAEKFTSKRIVKSKFGEFYNIAGIVEIEDFGEFNFEQALEPKIYEKIETDLVLVEEFIRKVVSYHLFHGIGPRNKELYLDGHIKATDVIMLDSNIKATYTLLHS